MEKMYECKRHIDLKKIHLVKICKVLIINLNDVSFIKTSIALKCTKNNLTFSLKK